MWRMLQADQPDTFVLATNETTTVSFFVYSHFIKPWTFKQKIYTGVKELCKKMVDADLERVANGKVI